MTLWDFLAQAGFWQWIGILILAECVAKAAIAVLGIIFAKRTRDS